MMRWLPLPFVAWCAGCWLHGERRWELLLFGIGVPLLAYTSDASRRFLLGILPMALLALIYDAMRFVRDVGLSPERVHLCDLRALDMRIASIDGGSVHDYLQAHATPALDIACAIPYGTFVYVTLAFAIWLYVRDRAALTRFAWSFLALNIAGFITYHIYPAAAPWYYHAYGCQVDLTSRASEGPNLARVDAWLGVGYFAAFYGRSNDVFGAVPSLHVGYPLLIVRYAWPLTRALARSAALAFFAAMCFAAVYLDHHWIIDVLLGIVYTLVVDFAVRLVASPTPSATLQRAASGP
ncbi:MAG TPA: phosphatase PAP2 family protein [Polyangiales bacterium]|nr:phosphatase PAP2 family protein [Polyangiales bacterium]